MSLGQQLELPETFPVQPRARSPESARLYSAVKALRDRGYEVYRAGPRLSKVDGALMTHAEVIDEVRRCAAEDLRQMLGAP